MSDTSIDVVTEAKMSVESKPQYARTPFQRQQGVVQGDVRMSGRLLSFRSEEGDVDHPLPYLISRVHMVIPLHPSTPQLLMYGR